MSVSPRDFYVWKVNLHEGLLLNASFGDFRTPVSLFMTEANVLSGILSRCLKGSVWIPWLLLSDELL